MDRLTAYMHDLKTNHSMTEYDIACGLQSGDLHQPEWLGICNNALGFCAYDDAQPGAYYNLDTTTPINED